MKLPLLSKFSSFVGHFCTNYSASFPGLVCGLLLILLVLTWLRSNGVLFRLRRLRHRFLDI
jgi:hypothetical protein